MFNFIEELTIKILALEKQTMKIRCATVTSTTPFMCKFDGENTELEYKRPEAYTPNKGDRVYFICSAGKYICLGKYV